MSHVVTMKVTVLDLDALERAAQSLGLELRRNQKTYKWYGKSVGDYPLPEGMKEEELGKCDHALHVTGQKGAYEVGVIKNKEEEGYSLVWDFWAGGYGLKDKIGENGNLLQHAYSAEVVDANLPFGFAVQKTMIGNELVFELTR